jgi:outer membrane protein
VNQLPFGPLRRTMPGMTRMMLAGALLVPSALHAQQPPAQEAGPRSLSLAEAVSLAHENNPNFLAQRNDIDVARWSVRSATADFLPSASAQTSFGYTAPGQQRFGSEVFGQRPEYYSSDYNVGLSLNLSGTKLLQPAVARAQSHATRQRVEGVQANLTANVTQQYLSVLQAQEAISQAERELARTGEYVRLAQARLDVGAGTPLDVRRAEVQQGQAEIRLIQARNSLATATLALGQLVGIPLEPGIQLSSEFTLFEPSLEIGNLMETAIQNNPTLLAARASADAAGTSVRQAQSTYLPTLRFDMGVRGSVYEAGDLDPLIDQRLTPGSFASCQQQNRIRELINETPLPCLNPADPSARQVVREQLAQENPSFPFDYTRQPLSASVTVSLPIFTGLTRQLQVQQARANAADARYQVHAQELQLRTDVGTALRNLETAYQTAIIQERVRATAAEELRLAQERFRFGAANSVEVTDAQTNLAEAERAQIDAVYNFHQSLAALEALVGQQLR